MSFGSDPLSKLSEEELLWTEVDEDRGGRRYTSTIDNEMIDGGIIQIITAGFGSNHDSDKFIIAICDDCIQSNLDDGTLLLFKSGSYVTPEEDLEKSKKIYKRRKRLDDLTGEL
jgi:hypothetical protein